MIDCDAKVREELAKGDIGENRQCEYYPCHFDGQNCSLCFCPFYPCNDPALGTMVESKKGGMIWSCEGCFWTHRQDVVKDFYRLFKASSEDPSTENLSKIKSELERTHLKDAKRVMVMGATSGAGKSLLTTALCRHFSDLGYRVSPFKGQNMSLNSTVTAKGEEIARAQDLQARAARAEPNARMNPILLKPIKDDISQVIVEGKPFKDMNVKQYYDEFALGEGVKAIARNLDVLRKINDIIVIEGAGSPAEINMMDKDITNMRTAEIADAVCILVVNIEWGGAFAYAYGTLMLLSEEQRRMFKGIIITNLHGGKGSLSSGEEFLRSSTGVPVLGVLPHIDLDLPDEDSMFIGMRKRRSDRLTVGVVRLPRISNFTDLDALSLSGAEVRYIDRPEEVSEVDAVIIPGTKSTVDDLRWLNERGMADALRKMRGSKPILGICGGYQMLGETIDDMKGIEGGVGKVYDGLGLLPVRTYFDAYEKRTVQASGNLISDRSKAVRGYEIHMGRTVRDGGSELFELEGPEGRHSEGIVSEDGMVFGTYLHGVFDLPAFRELFLSRSKITLAELKDEDYSQVVERSLDRLARALEENIDLDRLHDAMGVPK
ncbi:MAG: cobyric acid synthase [Euryarchaeota archaeon]|nr:cobyric acid synthase [Euryarchaeota archaeon]